MGNLTDYTIKNWRWWAVLPLMLVLLPIVLIDLWLALVMVCAELVLQAADDTRGFIKSLVSPRLAALRKWMRKSIGATP